MNEILTKQVGQWIASTLIAALAGSGCLMTGCVGHGSRVVEVEFFGQRVVVRDTIPPDSKGDTKYERTLDEDGWRFLFGWIRPEKDESE